MHAFNNYFVFITVMWYMTRKRRGYSKIKFGHFIIFITFFLKLTYASLFYFITQVYICIEGGVIIISFPNKFSI